MDVQPSTKSYQIQKGGEGAKQPPDKGSASGSRWGLRPYPPSYRIYGWMTLTTMWVPICLYCSNCTKFGQLILGKIIKIVATRCQILRLKCTKFDLGSGSAPDPPGGAYSAPPDPLAGFWGPRLLLRGGGGEGRKREGRERGKGEGKGGREGKGGGEGKGKGGEGKERKGKGLKPPQSRFSGYVAARQTWFPLLISCRLELTF